MVTTTTPTPGASATITNSSGKTVTLVADTAAGLASAFLAIFGLQPLAGAVTLADQLFDKAMAGYESGATVVVTEESISGLFVNLQLTPPPDAPIVASTPPAAPTT